VLAAVLFVIAALTRFSSFQILGHEPTMLVRGVSGLWLQHAC